MVVRAGEAGTIEDLNSKASTNSACCRPSGLSAVRA